MSNAEINPVEYEINNHAPGTALNPQCEDGANVEIITSREVPLGGPRAMTVHRTLPNASAPSSVPGVLWIITAPMMSH